MDECGQTAAILAAWRGRVEALQVLRWAGAALTGVTSRGGTTAVDAAMARCHGKTADEIADCLAVLGQMQGHEYPATAAVSAVATSGLHNHGSHDIDGMHPAADMRNLVVTTLIPPAVRTVPLPIAK